MVSNYPLQFPDPHFIFFLTASLHLSFTYPDHMVEKLCARPNQLTAEVRVTYLAFYPCLNNKWYGRKLNTTTHPLDDIH